jgi:hypothetical protein
VSIDEATLEPQMIFRPRAGTLSATPWIGQSLAVALAHTAAVPQPSGISVASRGVFAASASRQELVRFDLRVDSAAGAPVQEVRVWDFDRGEASAHKLASTSPPREPLAATFRRGDDAYFVLDRLRSSKGTSIRLLRYARGWTVDSVAEWSSGERHTRFALTTSADGSLVLSAWNENDYSIAILDLDSVPSPRPFRVRRVANGAGSLALPAFLGLDGLVVTTATKSGPSVKISPTPPLPKTWGNSDDEGRDHDHDRIARCF